MNYSDSKPRSSEEILRERSNELSEKLIVFGLFLTIFLSVITYFFNVNPNLYINILVATAAFGILYLLSRLGLNNSSRLIFCWLIPVVVMWISIFSKLQGWAVYVNPVNYFDVRIILIALSVIPVSIINTSESVRLFLGLLATFFSLLLFDPLHEFFGVGYFQMGMTSSDYYVSANVYSMICYFFVVTSSIFLKYRLESSERELMERKERSRELLIKLTHLSHIYSLNQYDRSWFYHNICKSLSSALLVDRVSLWIYNENDDSLSCIIQLENGLTKRNDDIFKVHSFPVYKKELFEQDMYVTEDVETDPGVKELMHSYIQPRRVKSFMHFIVKSMGKPYALMCCESIDKKRTWDYEETIFLRSAGGILGSVIDARKFMENQNSLAKMNDEITRINENLEVIVEERTNELKARNSQLAEYAFINSHILRAPVTRLLGLVNLKGMLTGEERESVEDMIVNSIKELDEITRKINVTVEEYEKLDRSSLMNRITQTNVS